MMRLSYFGCGGFSNYSDYINYSGFRLFLMEAYDEFFSHLFQFGIGGWMFEEEEALAELEIEEGAYFGIVAKGQEMAEQVEVIALEVEA